MSELLAILSEYVLNLTVLRNKYLERIQNRKEMCIRDRQCAGEISVSGKKRPCIYLQSVCGNDREYDFARLYDRTVFKSKSDQYETDYPESSAYVCISAAFYGHDSGFGLSLIHI